jgi:hypothetical protein
MTETPGITAIPEIPEIPGMKGIPERMLSLPPHLPEVVEGAVFSR